MAASRRSILAMMKGPAMSSNDTAFSTSSLFLAGLGSQLQTKAMKKMDANADGEVEQAEFQSALEKAAGKLGVELGSEEAGQMFASFDTDGDGRLSGSEVGSVVTGLLSSLGNLQNFMQSRGSDASAGFDANTFANRDLDGDGVLSLAEFTGSAGTTVTTTTITQIVETTVVSPDGTTTTSTNGAMPPGVPISESTGAVDPLLADGTTAQPVSGTSSLDSLIATMDTDGDGQVSGDELTAFLNQINTVVQHYNDTALVKAAAANNAGLA